MLGIKHMDCLEIEDQGLVYYGGNQKWFSRFTQQYGGCGPTLATNLLTYLSEGNGKYPVFGEPLLKPSTKEAYLNRMEMVYRFIRPKELKWFAALSDRRNRRVGVPSLGIGSVRLLKHKLLSYGVMKNLDFKIKDYRHRHGQAALQTYLERALEADQPIAMINYFKKIDIRMPDGNLIPYRRHWVLITGLVEAEGGLELEVLTWGRLARIKFEELGHKHSWMDYLLPVSFLAFDE